MNKSAVCILDNGAYSAKVGLNSQDKPMLVPNCIMKAKSERRRAFIGNQVEECRDASGLYFLLPFQKGYLINWDIQKAVWDHIFSHECSSINLAERTLIITEPQFNFSSIQDAMTEIFFEEYECDALYRTTAADLSAYNYLRVKPAAHSCCIIVDIGYSFIHIVPFIKGKKHKKAIRRIDIGGKVLTNHLKELISYRHLNVMDESYVVNQIKEDICFVSEHFKEDMYRMQKKETNTITQEYVLPDYTTIKRGYVRKPGDSIPDQQTLKLGNERFTIPEILFHPTDVGVNQMGVSEALLDSVSDCPKQYHQLLFSNIVVIGGSSLFPGMKKRLQSDIRALAPDDMEVRVIAVENPLSYPWFGGKYLCDSPTFADEILTREKYEEHGAHAPDEFDL